MSRRVDIRAWLNTPLRRPTRKTLLINLVVGIVNGVGVYARDKRVKKLEAQVATLEAWRRTELGRLK